MSDPLHLPPDPEPQIEQLRLGDKVVELDPQSARDVQEYVQALAAQYGASIEEVRRQALQSVGTNQPMPAQVPQYGPDPMAVPDPDILFRDKQAWSQEFSNSLQAQLGQVRGEMNQTAQHLAGALQQEFARRDAVAQAKAVHDRAMEEMLERRDLTQHTRIVQAIYNEQYDKLKHLPLEMGLDRIGQEAEAEIQRIRAGEKWSMQPGGAPQGVAPRAPARHLRSTQRAARPAPAAPSAEQGLQEPGGGLGLLGKMIRTHQAKAMG